MSRPVQKCPWEAPRPSDCDSARMFGSPAEAVTPETGMENWWSWKEKVISRKSLVLWTLCCHAADSKNTNVFQKGLDQFTDDRSIRSYSVQRQGQLHLAQKVFKSLIAAGRCKSVEGYFHIYLLMLFPEHWVRTGCWFRQTPGLNQKGCSIGPSSAREVAPTLNLLCMFYIK